MGTFQVFFVQIFVQRHGEAEESDDLLSTLPKLTTTGQDQVQRQAQRHLPREPFCLSLHSDTVRTRETATYAMDCLPHEHRATPLEESNFGYLHACQYRNFLAEVAAAQKAIAAGETDTLALWLRCCPAAATEIRRTVTFTILELAIDSAQLHGGRPIYIASHSSVAEAASPCPETTPTLQLGQIGRYEIMVRFGGRSPLAYISSFEAFPVV